MIKKSNQLNLLELIMFALQNGERVLYISYNLHVYWLYIILCKQ